MTTPILVGYVGHVAGAPRKWIVGVGLADAAMIIAYLDAVAKMPYVYFVWRERFGFADQPETRSSSRPPVLTGPTRPAPSPTTEPSPRLPVPDRPFDGPTTTNLTSEPPASPTSRHGSGRTFN